MPEFRDGPTPNGGVRAALYRLDDAGDEVAPAAATRLVVVEYDAAGNPVHRTYARGPAADAPPDPEAVLLAVARAEADGDTAAADRLRALLDPPPA
jgi:hypothetical protein